MHFHRETHRVNTFCLVKRVTENCLLIRYGKLLTCTAFSKLRRVDEVMIIARYITNITEPFTIQASSCLVRRPVQKSAQQSKLNLRQIIWTNENFVSNLRALQKFARLI